MRIIHLFVALILCLPVAANAAKPAGAAPEFQVELVLFMRNAHPGSEYWPADPGAPARSRAVASLPVAPGGGVPAVIRPLGVSDYQLNAEAEALRREGLRPVLHAAWRQPVGPRDNNDWIWLDAGPVSGLVRVGLGRFLHIDTDLALHSGGRVIRAVDHRRLRSGELHYLDHPAFGILVRITR